ncbi:MAG: M23 family metallopeptidase [Phycisphaerales bacterium]|nr:M23 family metallopeptidase [Phycisphaerales bacterium]
MRWILILLLLPMTAIAQKILYPQGYFHNPVNIPILLAGNFGECRSGHFHSGIDIKTEGKENLPVFAAADGYISRVKMEQGGFGHAIYITHPNGYTTLYAHLNDFFPVLQKVVHKAQYERNNWEVNLNFSPNQFLVKKGQQIAWSGNTGGSTAPHLHFEIRNTKTEHPLNPQLFGFDIVDTIAPVVSAISLYNGQESIYEQTPALINVRKKNDKNYFVRDTIKTNNQQVRLGILVNDYMNRSENTLSFYIAEWYANDELQGRIILDDIGYDETRYLNACADYKAKYLTGDWYNSLFVLPNNKLNKIYSDLKNKDGSISLLENTINLIKIVLKDNNGNECLVSFCILQEGNATSHKECAVLWKSGSKNEITNHPNIRLLQEPDALYDNVCFDFRKQYQANAVSSRYKIHYPYVPLHKYADLSIKSEQAIPFALSNKVALLYNDGKKTSGKACTLSEGWFTALIRNFGDYWLVVDTTAPSIKPMMKSGTKLGARKEIRFSVSDNYTSIKKFVGSINNQWICFEQHENNWFYRIDEYCSKGKNKVDIMVADENGNEQKIVYYFVR